MTADHKVLSEGCESRNNHRYAVVVKDLATQFAKKKKNFSRDRKEFFLEPTTGEFIYTDNSLELAKPVKIYPRIIVRLHHTDQKQMGLLKEQCAE